MKATLIIKSALLLRLEIKRFGRVDQYYIDAKDSKAGELYGFREPLKATPFESVAEIKQIIDANTSKISSFKILRLLDYQPILAS